MITGSAAAGLTGLTFVVIALASEAGRVNAVGLNTFITPTIVHFGTVLALAAFMCVPHQTASSMGGPTEPKPKGAADGSRAAE